jgi:hypothetical protein
MPIPKPVRAARRLAALAWAVVLGASLAVSARGDLVIGTFEDQNPGPDTYKNDFRPTNGFTTGGFSLNNNFDPTFGAWSGFAVSSKVDNMFGGPHDYNHEYGAYAPLGASGTGSGGSATYGVAFNFSQGDALINLPSGVSPYSIDVTNTTYAAQAITQGDDFATAFQKKGDYFRLDILGFTGPNGTGTQVGDVPFYLANFPDVPGSTLQLVSNWTTVNLTPLAGARSLAFTLTSTDVGDFGMNTPAFFAVDNITGVTAVPEPSVLVQLGFVLAGLGVLVRRFPRGPGKRNTRSCTPSGSPAV